MLTKNEFRVVSRVFQISCFIYSIPFDWDNVNSKIFETKSNLKLVVSRFFVLWRLFSTVIILLRFHPITSWNDCDRNIVNELFHAILSLCYIAGCAEELTFHFYSREVNLLFNQLILFNRNQGEILLKSDILLEIYLFVE